jgi:copper(I)-binding protein
MITKNDIMKMKHMYEGIIIKANSKLIFRPGSYHIMFMKLLKPLQINNKYEVRFMFQNAGSILLKIPVKGRIITPEDKKLHHHH